MLHYVTTKFAGSRAGKRELIMRFYNLPTKKLGQSRPEKKKKKTPESVTVTGFVKVCLLREVDNWVSGEARRARRLRAGCLKTRFVLGLYLASSRFSNCGFMCYFWSFLQSRACVRRSRHLLGFLTLRLRRRFRSRLYFFFREGVSPRHRAISPVRAFSGKKK